MDKNLKSALANSLIHHTSGIAWVADEHLNLVFANKNFCDYFSVGRHPAGSDFTSKVPDEIWNDYHHHHRHVLETGECISREVALQTADGKESVFHLDMFPVGSEGKMVGVYATKMGSGLEKEQLKEANQSLMYLVQAASNAIWEWDVKTGKIFRNKTLLEMVGYGDEVNEDSEGLNWWLQKIHPEDVNGVFSQVKEVIRKKEPSWNGTYRFRCKNGSYKHVADRGSVIYEYGFPVKMIGSLRDVTDMKNLEHQLAEERLAKQKEISENVISVLERERTLIGHELHDNINQVLTVVRLYIGLLNPASKEESRIRTKSLELLNNTIEDIRSLSRELVIPQLRKKGLVPSIKELVKDIEMARALKINFSFDHQTYPINPGKKVTLFRIVQEQLRNILKYSKATHVEVRLSLVLNEVQLLIEDNGVGFNPRKKIKGIGLSNIRERTKFYNGTVDIEAAEGAGCRIVVRIPVF